MVEHGVVVLILLAIVTSAYRRTALEVVPVGVICAVLLWLFDSPTMTVLSVLPLSILAIVCRRFHRHRVTFALAAAAAIVCFYCLAAVIHYPKFREAAEMRKKYPPISLAERLAYEPRPHAATASATVGLAEPVATELTQFESGLRDVEFGARGSKRYRSLKSLAYMHDGFVDDFMRAQGFGFVRMGPRLPAKRQYIEIPDLPLLRQPDALTEPSEQTDGPLSSDVVQADGGRDPSAAHDRTELRNLHESSAVDFANPLGFGYARGRERVFGFQPHAFRNQPALPVNNDRSPRWQIANLELVSLLKHDQPVVYLSPNLPRMDELKDAPTRPLNEFERQALAQIRAGEQIVVEEQTDEMRMLGSLRAAQQCTQCHSVDRGDLLGAFTYRLRRDVPARQRPSVPARPAT